jgi:outer membrane protein
MLSSEFRVLSSGFLKAQAFSPYLVSYGKCFIFYQPGTRNPELNTNHLTIQYSITMFKKILSTAFFALALTTIASAQRIAYVDVTAILESLPEYQRAQEQLDKVATQWRQEMAQEQDKIKGMYSKYQAEQVLLSEEMKKQREEEIMTKEKDVREMQRQKFGPEGQLFKKREELVKPIQDKVYNAITRYAEDKGFEFVFDKGSASGMLFADKRYDKTEDIKNLIKKG